MKVTFTKEPYHTLFDVHMGDGVTILGTLYNNRDPELWSIKVDGVEFPFRVYGDPVPEGKFRENLMFAYNETLRYMEREGVEW